MFEKIKNHKIFHIFAQLSDVRSLGLLIFGIIVILVTWSGVKAVQTNFELEKEISGKQQQNKVSELENQNLKLRNEYLNTDQFLELAARRQFGLAAPGEKELLVPLKVAQAHTFNLPEVVSPALKQSLANKPTYQKNFQAWIDFFLHRPQTQ